MGKIDSRSIRDQTEYYRWEFHLRDDDNLWTGRRWGGGPGGSTAGKYGILRSLVSPAYISSLRIFMRGITMWNARYPVDEWEEVLFRGTFSSPPLALYRAIQNQAFSSSPLGIQVRNTRKNSSLAIPYTEAIEIYDSSLWGLSILTLGEFARMCLSTLSVTETNLQFTPRRVNEDLVHGRLASTEADIR